MVKSSTRRSDHYRYKLDGSVWNARITAEKEMMVEQVHGRYAVQMLYEQKVKDYLEAQGVFGIELHHYMNFMQECWSLSMAFTQLTLTREIENRAAKWLRRNLNATYLVYIASLFGVSLTLP